MSQTSKSGIEVPAADRSTSLEPFLDKYSKICAGVFEKFVPLPEAKPFLQTAYAASLAESERDERAAHLLSQMRELGLDGEILTRELDGLLQEDRHLKSCCTDALTLARYLNDFVAQATGFYNLGVVKSRHDDLYVRTLDEFMSRTYEREFARLTYSHLYNFSAELASAEVGSLRIERLTARAISALIGEGTPSSFLNPTGAGDFFLVEECHDPDPDMADRVIDAHLRAQDATRVMQYFKDGVVYVDYSIPHFSPEWVNDLRKHGVFFVGQPHRLSYRGGEAPYHLNREELGRLREWLAVYDSPEITRKLDDQRNKPRQSLMRAGDYFEGSHARLKAVDKLPDLAIALESLFAPNEKSEFNYRIAQSVAQLIGETPDERKQVFKAAKDLYDRRSKLLHGAYDVDAYSEGRFVTDEEIERWSSIVRRATLHVLTLYLQGWNNRDDLLKAIVDAALDSSVAEGLRRESDLTTLINHYANHQESALP